MENIGQNDIGQSDIRQFITFIANGQEFASNIMAIREIRGWTDTETLPDAPAYVRGIINLRGVVLPVIDLKAKLGLGQTTVSQTNVIIVIKTEKDLMGILVDAVSDIITLPASDIQPAPHLSGDKDSGIVDGIAIYDGRMVTILNARHMVSGCEGIVSN